MKNNKKMPKNIWKHKVTFFFWTRSIDPWCDMLQTLQNRRKYIGIILSDEHSVTKLKSVPRCYFKATLNLHNFTIMLSAWTFFWVSFNISVNLSLNHLWPIATIKLPFYINPNAAGFLKVIFYLGRGSIGLSPFFEPLIHSKLNLNKCCHHLWYADVISFFQQINVKCEKMWKNPNN